MLDRQRLLDLGGYREELIHQGEEMEIAVRAFQRGLACRRFPGLVIVHMATSVGRSFDRMDYYGSRNTLLWNDWYLPPVQKTVKQGRALAMRLYSFAATRRFGHVRGSVAGLMAIRRYKRYRLDDALELTLQHNYADQARPVVLPKAVVTHAGRRDAYQLALALDEGALLESLITDFYWNPAVYSALKTVLPQRGIPERICAGLNPRASGLHREPCWPMSARRSAATKTRTGPKTPRSDGGPAAGDCDRVRAVFVQLLASSAFRPATPSLTSGFCSSFTRIRCRSGRFGRRNGATPAARASLSMESEISMPPEAFESLAQEAELATAGPPPAATRPKPCPITAFQPIRSMWFPTAWTCKAFRRARSRLQRRAVYDCLGLPLPELVRDIQRSDVFVLPSLTEGFAQVILEAMACGVPVITTANTCAPDILTEGVHGFILPIRDAHAIEEKLVWGGTPETPGRDGPAGGAAGRIFTLPRFRAECAARIRP
ncbi:MAG: hypothetical protein FRX48_09174 [Lasallia pustulata]|uniref:Glycosyl transferase family 1 domain-containing protein n=1 Tax=Lasallia pustulata TaxID=136370 RepID=A0A5M8PDV5_9LECA|nr:MAG: hypothetical protein FRX48_09174 [Lasallia pustulata]